jgi:hypothetical protein
LDDVIGHFPEEIKDSNCQIGTKIDKSNEIDIIVESDENDDFIEKMRDEDEEEEEEDYFRPKNQGNFNVFKQNNEKDDGIYADCQVKI